MEKLKTKPIILCLIIYLTCWLARGIEYFIFRTDQSFIGEAVFHKFFGIFILSVSLWIIKYKWSDIGFTLNQFTKSIFLGLSIGITTFFVAYGVEYSIQMSKNNLPIFQVFVTSYATTGNRNLQGSAFVIIFCIIGNVINVLMEEGVFRGLMPKLIEEKYSFWSACFISSFLFGIWHIAQPIRNVIDGVQSPMGGFMLGLMLVGTSTILGIQYCMINYVTGNIWAGIVAHFINNTTINLLHIVTINGTDEMQTMRITIAQTLSFIIILIIYLTSNSKNKKILRS